MSAEKLSCIIVEDEPIAAEVLKDYIEQVHFLSLKGSFRDALYAMEFLDKEKVDVLFLDLHLPKLKGLDFLITLKQKPQSILCTAYHQYTLDAFEIGVVDYLLKPIAFPRFLKAVKKLQLPESSSEIKVPKEVPLSSVQAPRPFHFFNVNKKMHRLFFDEILYVESLKDYSRIVTKEQSIVTRGQIGALESLFMPHGFLRIHRSYMVSLSKITAYSNTEIEVEGKVLPIGRSYKQMISKVLNESFG